MTRAILSGYLALALIFGQLAPHPAGDIVTGTVNPARLGSGTADGTTFLRGDSVWAVPPGGGGAAWGAITGTLSDQTDLQTALNAKEPAGAFSGVGTCAANQWASALNDGSAPTCTQPGFSNLSGAATDAQVPNNITVDLATLATTATTANAGDSAAAFFSSGTVEVARGGTGAAPGADDQVFVADSTSAGTWRAIPDCDTAATSKVLYDTATNTFSCGTDQTGAGGGLGYTLDVQALTSSPVDAQTVYFGQLPRAPTATAATSRVYIRKAGTIKHANVFVYSGTAGTAEAWSLYIRLNNTTDTLIETISAATNERTFDNSSLSITVAAGDYIEIKSIQPTWVTNPLTTIYGGYVYIE